MFLLTSLHSKQYSHYTLANIIGIYTLKQYQYTLLLTLLYTSKQYYYTILSNITYTPANTLLYL
jgi:hypothetical protein